MKSLQVFSFVFICSFSLVKTNAQNCELSCPSNIIVKAEPGKEGIVVNFPAYIPPPTCGSLTYTPATGSFFRLGSHSIIVTSSTGQKCSFTVTVTDNEPPVLSEIIATPDRIWPISNKLKKVGLRYTVSDNGVNIKTSLTVSSNSPVQNADDYEIVDNHLIKLKSNRLPDGSPKIYTITVTATDDSGNKTTRTTTLAVSKTMTSIPVSRKP